MVRIFKFTACLMLALWLPSTAHCALEGVGLLTGNCSESCGQRTTDSMDACCAIEGASYSTTANLLKVTAPSVLACAFFLCLQLPATPALPDFAILPAESYQRPKEWTVAWHFVRRAAPVPRAPSASIA